MSSYRFYIGFTSASKHYLSWIKKTVQKLYGIKGTITFAGKSTYILKYAKHASISLIKIMYWSDSIVCLKRKKFKIEQTMRIIGKQAGITRSVKYN